jgi:hypothetical protein
MAAQIIDEDELQNGTEHLKDGQLPEYDESTIEPEQEQQATLQTQEESPTATTSSTDELTEDTQDVPDKYQGKSLEDVVRMHQEAEKLLGRQSSEVGELRKVVDDYISNTIQEPTVNEQNTDEEIDFYTHPEKAMAQAIDNHPKLKAAEEVTQAFAKQNAMQQLKSNHPDMQEILGDTKFADWIKGSKIRTQLFVQADQGYDAEAANELFSLWKERKAVVDQTVKAEKAGRKQAVKSGSTGSARGNPDSTSTKKFYRRADIIKLMRTDPDRYLALSDDIQAAYAEGRVK